MSRLSQAQRKQRHLARGSNGYGDGQYAGSGAGLFKDCRNSGYCNHGGGTGYYFGGGYGDGAKYGRGFM
jgi:hypothetical protein